MTTKWRGEEDGIKCSVDGISIDEFQLLDSTQYNSIQAFDSDTNICIFAKLSQELCREHLIKKKNWGLTSVRRFAKAAMEYKPDVQRGQKCGGENTAYKIFGTRKNPLDSGVGEYAFKPNTDNEKQRQLIKQAQNIVKRLEKAAQVISKPLLEEKSVIKTISQWIKQGIGEFATALSVGKGYHSICHVDNDFYYTVLTVAAPSKEFDEEIIYYFCFPEYSVKVPLKSGDILVFNPQILHSCSNPKMKGSFIMSAYVSAKTVLSAA